MYRAIWISDIHLGWAACRSECLLDFLKHHESECLYLVGDIVDGWQLKKSWYWKQSYNDLLQKLLRRARKGAQVFYIPGNHDEFARHFIGLRFGDIQVCREAVHVTADGRRLLVLHGDEFDTVVACAKWLAVLGSGAYDFTIMLNRWLNGFRQRMGFPYWSLSQFLKHKVKNAMMFVADYEHALAADARRRGFHGVVCGHIHRPDVREIEGIAYYNTGDWVESCTALVEHYDGRMELIEWRQEPQPRRNQKPDVAAVDARYEEQRLVALM